MTNSLRNYKIFVNDKNNYYALNFMQALTLRSASGTVKFSLKRLLELSHLSFLDRSTYDLRRMFVSWMKNPTQNKKDSAGRELLTY